MDDRVEPADAALALSEIGRRREQVIRQAAIPAWYWWATAILTIALTAAIESGSGALTWTGVALFTAGSLVISRLLHRALRGARPRRDLVAPGSVPKLLAGLAACVAVLLGVALATALSLKAAGVPYPGTIASAVTMVVFVAGGQMLMRNHTAFLVRRSRSQG